MRSCVFIDMRKDGIDRSVVIDVVVIINVVVIIDKNDSFDKRSDSFDKKLST